MTSTTRQEAMIALLEHYTSQLQSYKTNILALFIGFFAGIEALKILDLPYWSFVFWLCLAGGCLSGCLFYFIVRGLSFGAAASCLLRAVPDKTVPYDLLNQLDAGVSKVVLKEIDQREKEREDRKNESKDTWWDLIDREKDELIGLTYPENNRPALVKRSVLVGLSIWLFMWCLFLIGFIVSKLLFIA